MWLNILHGEKEKENVAVNVKPDSSNKFTFFSFLHFNAKALSLSLFSLERQNSRRTSRECC